MNYYVYVYLDTRKPGNYTYNELNLNYEPIYVGKGTKRRCKNHLSLRCKMENHFYHKLNKIIDEGFEPEIIIIKDNISENEAFEYEIELIKNIGRLIDNTGTLTNLTNGGEGRSGSIVSVETRKKLSDMKIGKKMKYINSDKHPMKDKSFDEFFGIERSTELKKLISKNANPTNKGKKMSPEYCDNISGSIYYWYKNNPDIKQKISNTLKKRFEDKKNHPRYGKSLNEKSKEKISKSLKEYFKENKKVISDETKKKISEKSAGDKNPSFVIYKIKNIETNEIITINGSNELKKFISNFKKEKGIGKTIPPSFNLIVSGKNEKYFILIDKYFPNRT